MESSEEEDDFPSIESITPQSKVDSIFQSHTEKGIRKLCCELLDLKDAVENLSGNMRTKYLAFLRISEEAVEMEHELVELRKHISAQGILVQDLITGVSHELDGWDQSIGEVQKNPETPELQDPLTSETDDHKVFLDKIDVLLAEHKMEEALEALDAEERSSTDLKTSGDNSSTEGSSYRSALLKRKAMLEDQLVEITGQPFISFLELQKALTGLMKLGKGALAHQLLLKFYGSRLQRSIEALIPSSSVCPKTYPATLSKLVFSIISLATMKSGLIFGDNPVYTNRVVQWAEWEIEYFVRSMKESAPSSETASALGAASICVQASLNYSLMLEKQGLKLSNLILVLLRPFIEEVLELNFRRARKFVLDLVEADECMSFSPRFAPPLSAFTTSSDGVLVDTGIRFMCIVEDILEQLTPLTILHFGGNILNRIAQLFDKYMDALIKVLPPESSDDDHLTELKEFVPFRAETDSEQLAILGVAFTIVDELLPNAVMTLWKQRSETVEPKSGPAENVMSSPSNSTEFKDWRRPLQHSFEKLRDQFCRQYVLNFIYLGEGETRLNAQIYLSGDGDDLYWDSDPLPSLPFQALFAKLQQLATVAGDVLLGKEKIQKLLLARLTETILIWLNEEQDFWAVFENDTCPLQPLGLQQLILDMHFTVEIARFAGYPSRNIHQKASAIITRAIRAFSAKGIEPQIALPEDEWFVETAKLSINKLLLGTEGSEISEVEFDEDHINQPGYLATDSEDHNNQPGYFAMDSEDHNNQHGHIVMDSDDDSDSSLSSSVESTESFASASMGELDSPRLSDD